MRLALLHKNFLGCALLAATLIATDVAYAGAPIVFANRDAPPASRASASTRPIAYQPAAPGALGDAAASPAGEPDLLYGYGRSRSAAQPVIDLRKGASTRRPALVETAADPASLGDDAFSQDPARDVLDSSGSAPTEFRHQPPRPAQTAAATPVNPAPRDAAPVTGRPTWLEQERTGAPYEAKGQWYVPTAEPDYDETGLASWYGDEFRGRRTASGETYDPEVLSAAHPTLPIPSLVQITNLANGREVIVRVNDRGPFHSGRLIDVSRKTAEVLGFAESGQAQVNVRYLGPAPKHVLTGAPAVAALPDSPAAPTPAAKAPVTAAARHGAFVVQAGAFSNPQNAARARNQLSTLGEVAIDVRGALQRVRVGAWETRAEANAARDGAVRMGFSGAVVALAD